MKPYCRFVRLTATFRKRDCVIHEKSTGTDKYRRKKLPLGVKISVYMQFEKQIYSLYFIHSQGVLFLQTALVGRRLVGVCILRKPAKPCGYWLRGFLLDFLITRRSCGSNPISATSKVLRIHRGSKDFSLFYLNFYKLSYFYIYSFLDRSIWAASGRRVSVMLPEGQVRRPRSA